MVSLYIVRSEVAVEITLASHNGAFANEKTAHYSHIHERMAEQQ